MQKKITRPLTCLLLVATAFLNLPLHAVPAEGHQIMISGPSPYAVEAGRQIAMKGGNVVDVAVATLLCLSVTSPYYASLGGGGFALVKLKSVVEALDFRETAPAVMNSKYFLKLGAEASQTGGNAVGVPGVPAGLWALHQRYGKMKWKALFEPSLRLAQQGFAVSGEWAFSTARESKRFTPAGLRIFLRQSSIPLKPGHILKQPALAEALIQLRDHNAKGFYEGPVAKDLVDSVKAAGGAMTLADLAKYTPRWLSPLITHYEGDKIYLMPPPSSGGVVIMGALKMMEKLGLKTKAERSAAEYHLLAEIEARAFRGRGELGDPDFGTNPVEKLTSDAYLDEMIKTVSPEKSVLPAELPEAVSSKEKTETTHFSVLDADGNAVALTVTLNGTYGSGVVTQKFGIALNDEIDDFTTSAGEPNMYGLVQGDRNRVEAGKRPLSSMSPTLIEKHGKVIASLGAPGGPRITSAVLQGIYRLIARGNDADTAVQTARVHHQFSPNILYVDRRRFAPEILESLQKHGHVIEEGSEGKLYIVHQRDDGVLEAAFDSRGEGAAAGF